MASDTGNKRSGPRMYPSIRTVYGDHTTVEVTYREGDEPVIGCGDTWCTGGCGVPAIVIPAEGHRRETKMRSSMTACGMVMQDWPVKWRGGRVEVPEEYRVEIMKRMWI